MARHFEPNSLVIIPTGVANISSVQTAFHRLGMKIVLSIEPDDVMDAPFVVLPGVGSFDAGMRFIEESKLRDVLVERINANRPTLAVCLGFQMLCGSSEESADARGLGVLHARATRFPDMVRVPQLGWNQVHAPDDAEFVRNGFAYFANSYRVVDPPGDGWRCAMCDYAGPFVAAVERGQVLACQFHPELSGRWGIELLRRWLEHGGAPIEHGHETVDESKEAPQC